MIHLINLYGRRGIFAVMIKMWREFINTYVWLATCAACPLLLLPCCCWLLTKTFRHFYFVHFNTRALTFDKHIYVTAACKSSYLWAIRRTYKNIIPETNEMSVWLKGVCYLKPFSDFSFICFSFFCKKFRQRSGSSTAEICMKNMRR